MTVEMLVALGSLAIGLGFRDLWARKRTSGQVANEFAQAADTMLRPLERSITLLGERVAAVERENHILTADNVRLRIRVDVLEQQLHGLGVKPEPENGGINGIQG